MGYEVYRMGRALIEKSPQLDASLLRYGTIDTFLESGLGVCILRGHEYVCKAGADMEVGGAREAGLVTEPLPKAGVWYKCCGTSAPVVC